MNSFQAIKLSPNAGPPTVAEPLPRGTYRNDKPRRRGRVIGRRRRWPSARSAIEVFDAGLQSIAETHAAPAPIADQKQIRFNGAGALDQCGRQRASIAGA